MEGLEGIFERYKGGIRVESIDFLDPVEMELVVPLSMLNEYKELMVNRDIIGFWNKMSLKNRLREIKDIKVKCVYDGSNIEGGRRGFRNDLVSALSFLGDVEAEVVKTDDKEIVILYREV